MDRYNVSSMRVVFDALCVIAGLLFFMSMIFLFMILPGCQIVYNLPPHDGVDKKIMDYQLSQIDQNSRIHSSHEANHVRTN